MPEIIINADGDTLHIAPPDPRAEQILAEAGLHREHADTAVQFLWSSPYADERHSIAGHLAEEFAEAGYTVHIAVEARPTADWALTPLDGYAAATRERQTAALAVGHTEATTALGLTETQRAAVLTGEVLAEIREFARVTAIWLSRHPDRDTRLHEALRRTQQLIHHTDRTTAAAKALLAATNDAATDTPTGDPTEPSHTAAAPPADALTDSDPGIIITDTPLGITALGGDELASALLQHAGFTRHPPSDTTPEWYSLPDDRRQQASQAAEMLRAARYHVELDPRLYIGPTTTPTDPQGLKFVGAAIADATALLVAAHDAGQVERAVEHIVDSEDGALARLLHFLDAAADKYSDPAFRRGRLSEAFTRAGDALAEFACDLIDAVERHGPAAADRYPMRETDTARRDATTRAYALVSVPRNRATGVSRDAGPPAPASPFTGAIPPTPATDQSAHRTRP